MKSQVILGAVIAMLVVAVGVTTGCSTTATDHAVHQGIRIHVVQAGDTLAAIAKRYYGDRSYWRAIFDANRDRLDDPSDMIVGMDLVIPYVDGVEPRDNTDADQHTTP